MNIEYLANLAEITSGILVVVTLIFLIVQIRDNTKALKNDALSKHYTDGLELMTEASRTPALAEAAYKAFTGQAVEGAEKYQISNWVSRTLYLIERLYYMMEDGVLDEDDFERACLPGKNLLLAPAAREAYYRLVKQGYYGEEFKAYIERYYAQIDQRAEPVVEQDEP